MKLPAFIQYAIRCKPLNRRSCHGLSSCCSITFCGNVSLNRCCLSCTVHRLDHSAYLVRTAVGRSSSTYLERNGYSTVKYSDRRKQELIARARCIRCIETIVLDYDLDSWIRRICNIIDTVNIVEKIPPCSEADIVGELESADRI